MKRIFVTFLMLGLAALGVSAQEPPQKAIDTLPAVLPLKLPSFLDAQRVLPNGLPISAKIAALGRQLFFDPILSKDKSMACSSCHRPDQNFASNLTLAIGIDGALGKRNTPTVFNRGFGGSSFWDGRAATLEQQVLQPIENPVELGHSLPGVLKSLREESSYRKKFQEAFGPGKKEKESAISASNVATSLASFLRILVLADSPVDRFHRGDSSALNVQEKRGLWLFESRGGCWQCHTGFNLSDEKFHNTGVSWTQKDKDQGRFGVTKNPKDLRAFKTPTLRGLTKTAPYMHDGSLESLKDVVLFYNGGGVREDSMLDRRMRPLGLSETDVNALVALLQAMSRNVIDPTAKSMSEKEN